MVTLPAQTTTALKEWASVLEAIDRGEQLVLIRKGGLIEPGSGFELAASCFVLYPTFEHQTIQYLRPSFQPLMEEALRHRPAEGQVRVSLGAMVVSSVQSQDPDVIERVRAFHVYNEAFVSQRLKWQPEQLLAIVVVRAFRLPSPQLLSVAPHYAGCRSWVQLDAPVVLRDAVPVLDDATFAPRAQQLTALLTSA